MNTEIKETKHTAGPWKVEQWKYRNDMDRDVITNGSHAVCSMEGVWLDDARHDEMIAVAKANARLIAAAPELLESLERLATFYANEDEEATRALALVAKAKGESA